jgi:hypothetical protein
MLNSNYRSLCEVRLPYAGRQKYMHSFDLALPEMAPGYEDYLEPVVALCRSAGATSGVAHMTVDEKIVEAGMSQRRPKPHVDGCFMPSIGLWGGHPGPSWLHTCNDVGLDVVQRMPVIVAASASGCRAWRGLFEGQPAADGDLSHISDQLGTGEILEPNMGYLLSADCVHESMRLDVSTQRTFLRIALPVEYVMI